MDCQTLAVQPGICILDENHCMVVVVVVVIVVIVVVVAAAAAAVVVEVVVVVVVLVVVVVDLVVLPKCTLKFLGIRIDATSPLSFKPCQLQCCSRLNDARRQCWYSMILRKTWLADECSSSQKTGSVTLRCVKCVPGSQAYKVVIGFSKRNKLSTSVRLVSISKEAGEQESEDTLATRIRIAA
ncbi:hypothetical protein ElyMa_005639900 [Elysia marginata]|uniref:Uncharacterized protein n=1 Tax=Elysia marginata TaxID=1093978 RepID=A0AAV4FBH0_9GAST|nr:hypothetical protein ElyMa_005639900 [Elysia marginata]